jgi:hypothetical protein
MHCDRCAQRLIEIDRYGQQLIGCIEGKSAFIVDLSVEDIQALRDGRQTRYVPRRDMAGD